MEIKRNEATLNRPKGDRVIDASHVFIDLPAFISQLMEEDAWKKNDRNGITIFKTSNITMVITALHKHAVIEDNTVDGLISLQVIKGKIKVKTAGGNVKLRKRQVINIHPHETHSIEAMDECVFLLTNYTCS